MAKAAQKNNEPERVKGSKLSRISDGDLEDIAGGMRGEFSDNIALHRLRVRCPVPGCSFECGEFADMNAHMRTRHPEQC